MTAEDRTKVWTQLCALDDFLRDGFRRAVPPAESVANAAAENATAESDSLAAVEQAVSACRSCRLGETRRHAVPGEGVAKPLVLVVGEGPGADEDSSGRPFVGRAGQLLDKMLSAISLDRGSNCYIANIVKCRPPGNRNPEYEEEEACLPFLERQIRLLQPRYILSLGNVPTKRLLATTEGITKLHGRWGSYKDIPLLPTFHPSALLRDESLKRPVWEDLKILKTTIDRDRARHEMDSSDSGQAPGRND